MKPTYRVPSMDEICAIPWNGYNAVSTFSGAGGSSLGYRMAGFRVLWASEFIDAARDSYNANKATYTIVDGRDIRQVTAAEILAAIKMQPAHPTPANLLPRANLDTQGGLDFLSVRP